MAQRLEQRRELSLGDLVEGFLLSLRAAGRTIGTLDFYREKLGRLLGWWGDVPITRLKETALRMWLVDIEQGTTGKPNKKSYVEMHRKAAARFIGWAVKEGHLRASPLQNLEKVKVDEQEPEILEPEEIERLLLAMPAKTYEGYRNRCMTALVYDIGLRVSDLVHLQGDDVDLERGRVRVLGKGREQIELPIGLKAREFLWTYLHRWRPLSLTRCFFVSAEGEPLSANSIRQWLRRAARKAGIRRRVYPHLIRHSFGTQWIRNGGDEFALQAILRHRTRDMTSRYVHLAKRDLERKHEQASPLDRLGG